MQADDLMETVSGSYGVAGAVDTILVMAAWASGVVLDVRGRDVESAELAIQFDKSACRWRILGNASEVHVSEQRGKIIVALKEAAAPMSVGELVEATGMKRNALEVLLGRMVRDGTIIRVAKGKYARDLSQTLQDGCVGYDHWGWIRRGGTMIEFKGSHFEQEVILWGVRWYVAYPMSYRQLEEMMEERGVEVDHSTLNR
jgi:hypothetical protein